MRIEIKKNNMIPYTNCIYKNDMNMNINNDIVENYRIKQLALINNNKNRKMQNQSLYSLQSDRWNRKTIRLRIRTNKSINMIIAIQIDKTMRDLAQRVLNCFHELSQHHATVPHKRRDLTVSAIKIQKFYVSKEEVVGNLLKDQDQVQCILTKAKPKYPNYHDMRNQQKYNSHAFNLSQKQRVKSTKKQSQNQMQGNRQSSFNHYNHHNHIPHQNLTHTSNQNKNSNLNLFGGHKFGQNLKKFKLNQSANLKQVILRQKCDQKQIDKQKSKETELKKEAVQIQQKSKKERKRQKRKKKQMQLDLQKERRIKSQIDEKKIEANWGKNNIASGSHITFMENEDQISAYKQKQKQKQKQSDQNKPKTQVEQSFKQQKLKSHKHNHFENNEYLLSNNQSARLVETFKNIDQKTPCKSQNQNIKNANKKGILANKEEQSNQESGKKPIQNKQKYGVQTQSKEKNVQEAKVGTNIQHLRQSYKKQEEKRKKNKPNSILEILSKATQQKEKKNRKKEKKAEKLQQPITVITNNDKKQNQKLNMNQANNNNYNSNMSGIGKSAKTEKQVSNNKITSPKVTFHNSPLMSPQAINLNSPKRKISNPAIDKIQLEYCLQQKEKQIRKQPSEPDRKHQTQSLNSMNPNTSKSNKTNENQNSLNVGTGNIQVKKEVNLNSCNLSSKIIIEQDSQVQSVNKDTKSKQSIPLSYVNPQVNELNNKISKYKLEFFNLGSESQDNQ